MIVAPFQIGEPGNGGPNEAAVLKPVAPLLPVVHKTVGLPLVTPAVPLPPARSVKFPVIFWFALKM